MKKCIDKLLIRQLIVLVITTFVFISTIIPSFAANKVFYYHTDAAGTPMAMTDEDGDVVWEADYMPFGEEYELNETVKNRQRFIGKEKDEETDLYYFGARYLDGRTGRFIKPDPVGISEADLLNPQRFNRYNYSLNNPYRYIDPDGKIVEVVGTEHEKRVMQKDIKRLKEKSLTGRKVFKKLEDSPEVIKIEKTRRGNSYNIDENNIKYNPDKKYIYSGKAKWHWRDPEVGLAHEAIHALHDIENNEGNTREIEESKTVGIGKYSNAPLTENKVRGEYDLERRPKY